MQPLRTEPFLLAPFLRSLTAAYLNEMPGKNYEIELNMPDNLENIYIDGDKALLNRAMKNLIGNSIRHNPPGCHITVSAMLLNSHACSVCIRDNGSGIPDAVIQALEENTPASGGGHAESSAPDKVHVMGLRIARQVILSHQGNFYFSTDRCGIFMELPVMEKLSP